MKWNCSQLTRTLTAALAGAVLTLAAHAAEPTALELIKEGNRHVGEDSKDKVTQIRSEKSVGGLTPSVWFVVFYDADARMKATEVKFGAGKKLDVVRPFRLFERISGEKAMDRAKLKVDSDEVLRLVQKEPLLSRVKLTNTRMTLEKNADGAAVWTVVLWAEKARRPTETVDIGKLVLKAEDGVIIERDLHIERTE
jgi:hypothetical protein